MLKKTLMTAAAALAITAGATTISTPDANAGVKVKLSFGGHGGHWGGHWGGHHGGHGGHHCGSYRVRIKYWHSGHHHFHKKWVWQTYC